MIFTTINWYLHSNAVITRFNYHDITHSTTIITAEHESHLKLITDAQYPPYRASYGMSLVNMSVKIHCVVTAPQCNLKKNTLFIDSTISDVSCGLFSTESFLYSGDWSIVLWETGGLMVKLRVEWLPPRVFEVEIKRQGMGLWCTTYWHNGVFLKNDWDILSMDNLNDIYAFNINSTNNHV